MIRLHIDKETLQDQEKLAFVVNRLLFIKLVSPNGNYLHDKKCYDYYKGNEPYIKVPNTDYEFRVFNYAKPITDIATKTFIGEFPDLTTLGNKAEREKVATFSQKLTNADFEKHIHDTEKSASICGSGFFGIYNELGDTFPRFTCLNPQFADVVYDTDLAKKPILAFNIVDNERLDGATLRTNYIVYVYTKDNVFVYETQDRTIIDPLQAQANKNFLTPLLAFKDTNGKYISSIEHGYSDIPIVEFPNNEQHQGDFECAIPQFIALNTLQNNRLRNIQDIVDYILLVKNARFGSQEETEEAVNMLKENKVLAIEGEDADARFLANPINQSEAQRVADDIKSTIHYITRVPDLSSVDFSQNASDPIIKIKTKPLIDLCKEKELYFNKPLRKVLKIILDFCERNDAKKYGTYNVDVDVLNIEYNHDLPSNDLDIVTQITNLSNAGVLNPEDALQHISWIKHNHEYMKGAIKWNEIVDKRKQLNNNNNIKANETNLERQNAKPMELKEIDNKRNGAIGQANKISDNKVE